MAVFVLDKQKQPLIPCSEKRARLLLERGRAVVHKRYPFTVRLKDRVGGDTQPLRLGIDPGSKTTGLALMRESEGEQRHVLCLFDLVHRGFQIKKALEQRRGFRRRRRSKNLRYRAPRFLNRTKPKGWLAPSLQHRVDTVAAWVDRLSRLAPVTAISQELVRFGTQKLDNPEIIGIEYQQGTLLGYEVREYLLEKWGRECAYCGVTDTPLEIEHVVPRSCGGSNRVSNLTLSCHTCNQAKGALPLADFFTNDKGLRKCLKANGLTADARLERVQRQLKQPLRDASAVNATRWALFSALKATGRGSYQRTRLTKHGFPRGVLMQQKLVKGFQTGDMMKAIVPTGKKAGTHMGRVAVRKTGRFNIQTQHGAVQGISQKHCTVIQRGDGYGYHLTPSINHKGGAGQAMA